MIYAIGDIHGQKARLEEALALIEADGGPDAEVVFLGDYADRGPDVRGVLDLLMTGIAQGRRWTALMGNHDRMFLRFLRDGALTDARILSGKGWFHPALGGRATLASYGVNADKPDAAERAAAAVPASHLAFLESRPRMHRTPDLAFVHAGIRPGIALDAQDEDDLLWIRDPFLMDTRDHGPLIVHGHTALESPTAYSNRVNLDGGAGYGRPLLPVAFDGREAVLLTPAGRQRLTPEG